MARPTQDELREREMAIVDEHRVIHGAASFEVEYGLIVKDRLERWAPLIKDMEVPDAIEKWAGMMSAIHGPEVLMHHGGNLAGYKVNWITALVIVRYGEAEYFWPDELGDEDVARARAWLNGKRVPPSATYIGKEV